MPASTVNLGSISVLSEIVLRGGDFTHPASRKSLKDQYARPNVHYSDVRAGLSCLFRPGASLDELGREGTYPNAKLSVAIVQRLIAELAGAGFEPVLYVMPIACYPDHHTLAVARGGVTAMTLQVEALDALIRAMTVVDNPYCGQQP